MQYILNHGKIVYLNETKCKEKMNRNRNEIKIIGGKWRRHKLTLPDSVVLRPTPNRVRETLFNWLSTTICQSRCLDLFAGSGALGLEALSRGANQVIFIDNNSTVCNTIESHLSEINTQNGTVYQQQFPEISPKTLGSFDVIFLDPPFHEISISDVCIWINKHNKNLLNPSTWIYSEWHAGKSSPTFPTEWTLHKQKQYGQVGFALHKATACST